MLIAMTRRRNVNDGNAMKMQVKVKNWMTTMTMKN
jgi:hypothetical protein